MKGRFGRGPGDASQAAREFCRTFRKPLIVNGFATLNPEIIA
jgi:hypothetical protein